MTPPQPAGLPHEVARPVVNVQTPAGTHRGASFFTRSGPVQNYRNRIQRWITQLRIFPSGDQTGEALKTYPDVKRDVLRRAMSVSQISMLPDFGSLSDAASSAHLGKP